MDTSRVEQVIEGYVLVENDGARSKWLWAKQLSELLDTSSAAKERTDTSVQIGARIAAGIGRAKPYGGAWIRNWVSAFRAYPEEPASPSELHSFLRKANGNAGESKSTTGAGMTAEDYLDRIKGFVRSALKHGVDPDSILSVVTDSIATAEGESDDS